MFSLKTAFVSNIARFSLNRQICLSSRKLADSDEWKPNTTSQEDDNVPFSGGLEKTINSVTLLGRVGQNPVKRGSMDHPVVTFSLATNSNYSNANGEVSQKTEWHRICVFKPFLRESTLKYTTKGQRVLVQGRIIYGEVREGEGQLRHTSSIVADDVIFFKSV